MGEFLPRLMGYYPACRKVQVDFARFRDDRPAAWDQAAREVGLAGIPAVP